MLALVGFLPSVRSRMLLKVTQLRELALTDLTAVRLNPRVNPRVLRQVRRVCKTFITRGTFVGFWILFVDVLGVDQQVRLGIKDLQRQAERKQTLMVALFFYFIPTLAGLSFLFFFFFFFFFFKEESHGRVTRVRDLGLCCGGQ